MSKCLDDDSDCRHHNYGHTFQQASDCKTAHWLPGDASKRNKQKYALAREAMTVA